MTAKLIILTVLGMFGATSFYIFGNKSLSTETLDTTHISKNRIAQNTKNNPVELGKVAWIRDLDEGIEQAKATQKPIFILFQEVPGCSNCTRYGNVVLSHPLIVEAIETYFVPVCIYNNHKGKDATSLKRFNEPAWNNPVVRLVEAENQADIVPRIANFRSTFDVVDGMKRVLDAKGIETGAWFDLLHAEQSAMEAGLETATFTMYCFWTGEGFFGQQKGVMATKPGFQNGHEVVQVQYDPRVTSEKILGDLAKNQKITSCSSNAGFSIDREPKYYLAQTYFKAVPMTELQAARANSMVGKKENPAAILSPLQIALAERFSKKKKSALPNFIASKDLVQAWEQATKK